MSPGPSGVALTGRRLQAAVAERTGDAELLHDLSIVGEVLPVKVTQYVLDELIDWTQVPDDPIYRLLFPHRDMLEPEQFSTVEKAVARGDRAELRQVVAAVRAGLNPHPGDQLTRNVPSGEGVEGWGLQHKYAHTLLVFPRQGQTCHSYCAYCFRWAQFTGDPQQRLADSGAGTMLAYLSRDQGISDVLLTGGDPLVMRTDLLRSYLEPLLEPRFAHVRTVRIGTKSVCFWPYRVTAGPDADELVDLVGRLVEGGKHVAFMLHLSHARELLPEPARRAVQRLRDAGATLRSQAPVVRHVNDDAAAWAELWAQQVGLGIHPYYMFVERDTGAQRYFGLPLVHALDCYRGAIRRVSGLGRTARGPVMSTSPGKVVVDGVVPRERGPAFALRYLQARDETLVGRPFFAVHDPAARWWSELSPYDRADEEFFRSGVAA